MLELIDRHALLKKVYEHTQERERMTDGEWCRKCIYEAPTIEAEPVRHGRWIKSDVYTFKKCSECGAIWDTALCENIFFIYCPRCGSKNGGADNG